MSNKNLLLMIIDTNPILWSLYDTNIVKDTNEQHSTTKNSKFKITDFINSCVGFINAYIAMNQDNAIALIAAHNTKAEYLYPTRNKKNDKTASPWNRCEQIFDINEQIKTNLNQLISNDDIDSNSIPKNNSTLTSAFGLALCCVNRVQKQFQSSTETINYRILIVKLFEDASNQYMNFMNMIFTAEKLNIPIDSCVLLQDSSLLQQASNLTNGIYCKIPQIHGLLHYLLWIYLPNENTRKMLVSIPKAQVDFRAACFCHRQLIDIGYVCSVCLSVFCSFTPICSTCDCNFEFDLNILKLGKKIDFNSKKSTQLTIENTQNENFNQSTINLLNSKTTIAPTTASILSNNKDEIDKQNDPITTRIISVSTNAQTFQVPQPPAINRNAGNFLDDSFEMLE